MPDWLAGNNSQWFWQMIEALAVIVSLGLIVRQLRLAHIASMLETLHKMDERWSSDALRTAKQSVCEEFLSTRKDGEHELGLSHASILSFLEELGIYCKRGVLDVDVLWDSYSQEAQFFWVLLQPRVQEFRAGSGDATWYENTEWLVGQLDEMSKKRGVSHGWISHARMVAMASLYAPTASRAERDGESPPVAPPVAAPPAPESCLPGRQHDPQLDPRSVKTQLR